MTEVAKLAVYYDAPGSEDRQGPIIEDGSGWSYEDKLVACASHYHRRIDEAWEAEQSVKFTLYDGEGKQIGEPTACWINSDPIYSTKSDPSGRPG